MGEIQQFYDGATVFVTGVTGFLGKVSLAKLVTTCKPRKVYILLRAKKSVDIKDRLKELFDAPIFDALKKEKPDFMQRIVMIPGDCEQLKLGMSDEDISTLSNEVDVIIHWAATVRFNENLKRATFINARATRDLIRLARQMPNLKAFVHCSTAFSNCTKIDIDEKFYGPPKEINLIDAMEAMDESLAAEITPNVLREVPNTYIYTKALAEDIIRTEGKGLPITIIRPSIVAPCMKEPLPGWVENVIGFFGFIIFAALGIIRLIRFPKNMPLDNVPADYVVNAALASGWDVNKRRLNKSYNGIASTDPTIFNVVSSPENPIILGDYIEHWKFHGNNYGIEQAVWHFIFFHATNKYLHSLLGFFLHYVPAFFVDFYSICRGRKPRAIKIYKKIDKLISMLDYFMTTTFNWRNDNTKALWNRLNVNDKKIFTFSMANLDWSDYIERNVIGAKLYVLKEPLDNAAAGRRRLKIVRFGHYTLCGILLFLLYKLLSWVCSCVIR